jgi:hypothetical protein
MERSTSKKTNEPPKRANHKGNIKFPNPVLLREAYQIRKRELSQRSMSIYQIYMKRREKVSITFPKKTSACAFLQQQKSCLHKISPDANNFDDTRHKEHLIFSFHNTQLSSLPKWYNA